MAWAALGRCTLWPCCCYQAETFESVPLRCHAVHMQRSKASWCTHVTRFSDQSEPSTESAFKLNRHLS